MQHKILANVGFKNTIQNSENRTSTTDNLKDIIVTSQILNTPLFFSNNGVPVQSSLDSLNQINSIIDIVKNGGSYYAFDIETLGKFDGTKEEQKLFAITEAALKKFTYGNGKLNVETVHNIRLGLNREQINSARSLFSQAQLNSKSLTESQIFTLKSLSSTGSALKSNGLQNFSIGKDGMPIIPIAKSVDTLDFESINYAINAYEDLFNKGLYLSNVKGQNTAGNKLMNSFLNDISHLSQDNLILGHNSNIFDIPALNFVNNKYFNRELTMGSGSIDTLALFNSVGLDVQSLYSNQNVDVNRGYAKLENLAVLFGIDKGKSHIGADDTNTLGMLGSATINYNGSPMTLFDIMRNKAKSNIRGSHIIDSNNGDIFRVVRAPMARDLQGNYLNGTNKSFDFILETGIDSNPVLNKWTTSPLHSNGFFSFKGTSSVNVNQLTQPNSPHAAIYKEYLKDLPDGTKELYIAQFQNIADPTKTSYIVRDSMSSLQKTIEQTFELSNGTTIDTILREERMYNRDLARREISSFEYPGAKGSSHANMFYEQLAKVKDYEYKLGREFTESDLQTLVANKEISIGNRTIKSSELFSSLTFGNTDEVIKSRVNTFIHARKYLETTAPVSDIFSPVINKAYKDMSDFDYVKNAKTLAYRSSWNKLANWIVGNGDELITQTSEFSNISKSKTFRIQADNTSGEFYSLDMSSKDKLLSSLKSIANKEVLNNSNTNTRDLAKSQNLDSLYNKLSGVLTDEQITKLRKNKSIDYELKEAAGMIFENVQKNYTGLTDNELSNPFSARNNFAKLLKYDKLTEEQISSIQTKLNNLNWVINNTAAGNVESLDFENGARVRSANGEMSITDYIANQGMNVTDFLESLANESIGETTSLGKLYYDSKTGGTNINKLSNILSGKLNWTSNEQEQFSKVFTSSKGLNKLLNSKGEDSLAWAFIEATDKNPRNNGIKLVLTDQKYLGTLAKAVETNDLDNGRFIVIDMPTRINKDGINVIKKGGLEVADIQTFNLFGSKKIRDEDVAKTLFRLADGELNKARHMNVDSSSYVSQMIADINFYKDEIFDAIENNRGQIIASKYNRAINRDIQKSSGFTGYASVLNEQGDLVRRFVGNHGDISKNNMVDTTNLINFMPFLAKENDSLNDDMIKFFGKDWNEYRDSWINELTNIDDKYSRARSFDEVHSSVKEYYVKNLLGENGIINQIINSDSLKSVSGYTKALPLLNEILSNGSQLLGSKTAQQGFITLKGANVINPGSELVGPIRDLVVQQTQYVPLHLGAVEKYMNNGMGFNDYVSELNRRGITLGRTFESADSSVVNLLNKSANDGVIEGFTGKVKLMNDHEILNVVNDFKTKLDSNSAKNFADKYGLYSGLGNDEIVKAIQDQLSVFESSVFTYQQRAVLNPALNQFFNVPDIHQFNVNDVVDLRVAKGSSVKDGTFLGFDAKGNAVRYKDKRAGVITGIEDGRLSIAPNMSAITETKINYGITEKSTAHLLSNNPTMQALFDELIGSDIAAVAYPDQAKHLAGMFAFNEMNTIGQYLLQYGSDSQQQEFANMLNKIGGSGSSIDIKEINGQTIKRFLYSSSSEGNTFKQYSSVVDEYRKLAEQRNSDPLYSKLVQMIDSNRANAEAVLDISIMQHNTQYSAQSDEYMEGSEVTGHHGGKFTMRDAVYLERKVGHHPDAMSKFYRVNADGTKTPTAKVLVDSMYSKIRQSEEFISAKQDIQNILYSIQLQRKLSVEQAIQDTSVAKELLVKKVSLSDLYLPSANTDSEKIAETIFGIGEGYNSIEIDLGDMKILDPLTGERTNTIIMPVLNNQFIDNGDMFVKLDIHKSQSKFYNDLQRLMLNKEIDRSFVEKSLKDFWREANKSIKHKDGYLNQKVTSGRLPFSSNVLYGGIIAPLYDEDYNLQYDKFNVNLKRQVDVNGKTIEGIIDVNYITEQGLKEMIGQRGLEDIGFQLVHNGFDENERFKKLVSNMGLLNGEMTEDIYEQIGKQFMLTEGIAGIGTRYPAFNTGASVVSTIRLNPLEMEGTSVYTLAHTALKQNADTDWDSQKLAILGERDVNGRFRFFEKGSVERTAIEDLYDAETLDNMHYWIKKAKEDEYDALAKSNSEGIITRERFKELAEAKGMRDGNWNNDDARSAIINARYKQAISDMSTPNYMIFDIATSMFEQNKGIDEKVIKDIQEFTQLVEQSPISAKFAKISVAKNRIGASADYATAIAETISNINNGDSIDESFNKIVKSLGAMDILDIDNVKAAADKLGIENFSMLSAKDYRENGVIENILDIMSELDPETKRGKQSTLLYGLAGMHQMFSDSNFLSSAWNDTFFNFRNPYDKAFIDTFQKLSAGEIDASTTKGQIMNDIINNDYSVRNSAVEFERVGSVRNRLYYDKDGSVFNVRDGVGLPDKSMIFDIRDTSDMSRSYFFKNTYDDALSESNSSINRFLKNEVGLKEIEIAGNLSAGDLALFENSDFARTYVEGRNIIDKLDEEKFFGNRENSVAILEEYNRKIIKAGRNAKDMNEIKSNEILERIISTNLNNINSSLDYNEFVVDFHQRFGTPGSAIFQSDIDEKSISGISYQTLANRGNQSDNILYKSVAPDFTSYSNETVDKVKNLIDNDVNLSKLDNSRKATLLNRAVSSTISPVYQKEIGNIDGLRDKLIGLYTDNVEEFRNNYGWGLDVESAIAGINLSSQEGIDNAVETVKSFGEARVGFGRYTGHRVSELTAEQIRSIGIDYVDSIRAGSNQEFLNESMEAIKKYDIIKGYVASENILNNEQIEEVLQRTESNARNYTTNMKNSLDEESIKKTLWATNEDMNDEIIRKANKKIERGINEGIDKASKSFNSHMKGTHFIAGAGIIAATTLMMSYSGVASSLDPGKSTTDKENLKQNVQTPSSYPQQTPSYAPSNNNAYMTPRASTKIRMNSPYASVNDPNVLRALNFAGGPNARVQIHERNGQNNNSWLQNEIANNLV